MNEREKQIQVITRKLRTVYKSVQAHSKSVEKMCGLSSAQLSMLHEIGVHPGMKVSQLAAALTIHASTCSNMLDKLEVKDLIHRDRRKTDQRSVYLYVTEKGKQLLANAPKPVKGKLTHALEQLENQQLERLDVSLEELISALNVTDDSAGFTPIAE